MAWLNDTVGIETRGGENSTWNTTRRARHSSSGISHLCRHTRLCCRINNSILQLYEATNASNFTRLNFSTVPLNQSEDNIGRCGGIPWKMPYPRWPAPPRLASIPQIRPTNRPKIFTGWAFYSESTVFHLHHSRCIYALRIQMNGTERSIAPSRLRYLYVDIPNVFSLSKYMYFLLTR